MTRGHLIILAGPDGVGKSTLADAIEHRSLMGRRVLRLHHRAHLFPRRAVDPRAVTEPHLLPPYPAPISLAKVAYLYFDQLLGWLLRVRPFMASGGWVVLERGWLDAGVDPRRYRLKPAHAGIIRRLVSSSPRPDLFVLLEASAEVLRARSDQLPADELDRQAALWRAALPTDWPSMIVDASMPTEAVFEATDARIERLLHARPGA